jgi:hypothetical protein
MMVYGAGAVLLQNILNHTVPILGEKSDKFFKVDKNNIISNNSQEINNKDN